jgi:hypothetical protein
MSKLRIALMLVFTAVAIVTLPNVSAAQPNAWGGGCHDDGGKGMDECIAAFGSEMPLNIIANFGINNWSNTLSDGIARYWICWGSGSGCSYHMEVETTYLGSYPLMWTHTGEWEGYARSEFDMLYSNLYYYDIRDSPWQYWIP